LDEPKLFLFDQHGCPSVQYQQLWILPLSLLVILASVTVSTVAWVSVVAWSLRWVVAGR
jgi:hypothetical protein